MTKFGFKIVPGPSANAESEFIQRLVSEIGLSESEAIDLVRVLGTDWSSLVREARLLRSKR